MRYSEAKQYIKKLDNNTKWMIRIEALNKVNSLGKKEAINFFKSATIDFEDSPLFCAYALVALNMVNKC